MLSVEKVATPATAATVAGRERAPPAGFVPTAPVTSPVKPGRGFPAASDAVSRPAGAIVAPAVVVPGCTVKASRVAAPTVMVKGALVAPVSPLAAAVRV